MTSGYRAQMSVEYILTFATGLIITTIAGYILLQTVFGVMSTLPDICSFDIGVKCTYWAVGSNSTNSAFLLLGSNVQQYPIKNLELKMGFAGGSADIKCLPTLVKPGAPFICESQLDTYERKGTAISGNMLLHIYNCGLSGASCNSPAPEDFVGTYLTKDSAVVTLKTNVILSPPRYASPGVYLVDAGLSLMGFNYSIGTIKVDMQQNPQPQITFDVPGASLINLTTFTLAKSCALILNANYSNSTAYAPIPFMNVQNYSGSTYSVSGQNKKVCLSLTPNTKSVSVSGQNNTLGVFSQPSISSSSSLSGSYNNLVFFNTNGTVSASSGSYNNVTIYNGNVMLTVSGNYNQIKLVNSRLVQLTMSGSNNRVILQNTPIGSNTISGTNNIIQNV